MTVLVVTGGIGSGKSTVCRILAEKGLTFQYNADARVKMLYSHCSGLLDSIEQALEISLRDENGSFLPSLLAARIFSEKEALDKVESLVFPYLKVDFESFLSDSDADADVVVFESATVLEKPQFEGFGDKIVLVDAPFELRLERACRRDGADKEAVLSRMRSQKLMNALSQGASDPRIDAVIVNDCSPEILEQRVNQTMSGLFGDWQTE